MRRHGLDAEHRDDPLGPKGEAEWDRLRRQIEMSDGFWLGFVFSPSPRAVATLCARSDRLLRARARTTVVLRPETADAMGTVLHGLFGDPAAVAGCTWVDAVRSDPPGSSPGPWTSAWDELLLRMNERRDALRRRLSGGLILAAPPAIKARARDAAPDLWSVRSLVLELPAIARAYADFPLGGVRLMGQAEVSVDPAPDPELALAEAKRRAEVREGRTTIAALDRAAEGFLAQGRIAEAVAAARQALDLLRGVPQTLPADVAAALARLAQAEHADGDDAAAAEHIAQAISLKASDPDPAFLRWYDLSGQLALQRADLGAATRAYEDAVPLARRLLGMRGESPQTLHDLAVSLTRLGDARREIGEHEAATAAYEESMALDRRVLVLHGEFPSTLRAIAIDLGHIADARSQQGDLAGAVAATEEALALSRRVLKLYGESRPALRDVAVSLIAVGDAHRGAGNLTAATAAYEEALLLGRRLLEGGETSDTLLDLSATLQRIGDVRLETGDLAAANAAYEECLTVSRRLQEVHGNTPETLRDLLASLERIADVRHESGDLPATAVAYEEGAAIARRLLAANPTSNHARGELRTFLDALARVRHVLGDEAASRAAENEASTL